MKLLVEPKSKESCFTGNKTVPNGVLELHVFSEPWEYIEELKRRDYSMGY